MTGLRRNDAASEHFRAERVKNKRQTHSACTISCVCVCRVLRRKCTDTKPIINGSGNGQKRNRFDAEQCACLVNIVHTINSQTITTFSISDFFLLRRITVLLQQLPSTSFQIINGTKIYGDRKFFPLNYYWLNVRIVSFGWLTFYFLVRSLFFSLSLSIFLFNNFDREKNWKFTEAWWKSKRNGFWFSEKTLQTHSYRREEVSFGGTLWWFSIQTSFVC